VVALLAGILSARHVEVCGYGPMNVSTIITAHAGDPSMASANGGQTWGTGMKKWIAGTAVLGSSLGHRAAERDQTSGTGAARVRAAPS
jgi:hypothetical protein